MANINRRDTYKLMSAFGASVLFPTGAMSAASKISVKDAKALGLDTETGRLNALVRLHGDSAGGTRYWYSDITRYAVIDRKTVPLFSQVGLQAVSYKSAGDDVIATIRLCGYFLTTEDRKLITTYNNPFTNQANTVPAFRSGPAQIRWSKGIVVWPDDMPYEARESIGNIRTAGNRVWFDWEISTDQKWGNHRDFLIFNASIEDLLEPDLTSVPAIYSINDIISWFNFMNMPMGKYPGFCLGLGVGTKLDSVTELPPYLLDLVEQHDPAMIHDVDQWAPPSASEKGA